MDYSVSSSRRCGRGFAGSRGWLQGPGASRGPCQGEGGPFQGVPKQQRDRSFQSTWRGEGRGEAKKEKVSCKDHTPIWRLAAMSVYPTVTDVLCGLYYTQLKCLQT